MSLARTIYKLIAAVLLGLLLFFPAHAQDTLSEGWYYKYQGGDSLVKYDAFFQIVSPVHIDLSHIEEKDLFPLVFSPSGRLASSDDQGIYLLDVTTGEKEYLLIKKDFFNTSSIFRFETDSSFFYNSNVDAKIFHFDLRTGQEKQVYQYENSFYDFSYDPYQRILWMVEQDRSFCGVGSECLKLLAHFLESGETREYSYGYAAAPQIDSYGSLYLNNRYCFDPATESVAVSKDDLFDIMPYFRERSQTGPMLGLTSKNVLFEKTTQGSTATTNFTFYNHGDAALRISDVNVDAPFSTNLPEVVEIEPSGYLTFQVSFEPNQSKEFESFLTFVTNDQLRLTDSVRLSGVGYQMNTVSAEDGILMIDYSFYKGNKLKSFDMALGTESTLGNVYFGQTKSPTAINSKGELFMAIASTLYQMDPKSGALEQVTELFELVNLPGAGQRQVIAMDFDSSDNLILAIQYHPGSKEIANTSINKYSFETSELVVVEFIPTIGESKVGGFDLAIDRLSDQYYLLYNERELYRWNTEALDTVGFVDGEEWHSFSIFFTKDGELLGLRGAEYCCSGDEDPLALSTLFSINKHDASSRKIGVLGGFIISAATAGSYRSFLVDGLVENINEVRIYPNPATDLLTIETVNNLINIGAIRLYDLSGNVIYKNVGIEGKSPLTIDLQSYAVNPGLYLLEIRLAGGQIIMRRIIME
ncbi:MAG: T9SS type A sorting domain-containing protein [Imperialibacter sp.]|uniref:T9SS type A sorting domain-containing protein n=1 Tax=Imperialibacter sp. TaxID=2038411 RepID=UPI0032F08687